MELVVWNCGSIKLVWFHGVGLEYDFCMNVAIFGIVQYRYCVLPPGSWGICSTQDCPWHCLASGKQVNGFISYSLPLPMKQSSTVACIPVIITHFLKEFGAPSSSNFNKFLVPCVCWWIGWMGGGAQDDFSQTVQFLSAQHQEELTLNSYPWLFCCELINVGEFWSCVSYIQHWFSPGGFVTLAPFTGLSYLLQWHLKCKQVDTRNSLSAFGMEKLLNERKFFWRELCKSKMNL